MTQTINMYFSWLWWPEAGEFDTSIDDWILYVTIFPERKEKKRKGITLSSFSLYIYMCVCVYICTIYYVFIIIHICVCMYTCMYVYNSMYIYTYIYVWHIESLKKSVQIFHMGGRNLNCLTFSLPSPEISNTRKPEKFQCWELISALPT